jgi:hypothetical protein
MAYNKANYYKKIKNIIDAYEKIKHYDIPDTFIVAKEFPKHGIFISYRQWMNIKGTKMSSLK